MGQLVQYPNGLSAQLKSGFGLRTRPNSPFQSGSCRPRTSQGSYGCLGFRRWAWPSWPPAPLLLAGSETVASDMAAEFQFKSNHGHPAKSDSSLSRSSPFRVSLEPHPLPYPEAKTTTDGKGKLTMASLASPLPHPSNNNINMPKRAIGKEREEAYQLQSSIPMLETPTTIATSPRLVASDSNQYRWNYSRWHLPLAQGRNTFKKINKFPTISTLIKQ